MRTGKEHIILLPRIVTFIGHKPLLQGKSSQKVLEGGSRVLTLPPDMRLFRLALIAYVSGTPMYLKRFLDDIRYESVEEIRAKHSDHDALDAPILEWGNYLKTYNNG